jgi:hypothetical protein
MDPWPVSIRRQTAEQPKHDLKRLATHNQDPAAPGTNPLEQQIYHGEFAAPPARRH